MISKKKKTVTRSSLVSDGSSVGPEGRGWPAPAPGGHNISPPPLHILSVSGGGVSLTPTGPTNNNNNISHSPNSHGGGGELASPTRLKRITNTDSVFTMCQTPEGTKFQCAMCARVFNLKCTLLRHVRHQHQGRFVPHPCKTCGQIFKRTDHLKVHMKKIHNVILPNTMTNHTSNSSPLVNTV